MAGSHRTSGTSLGPAAGGEQMDSQYLNAGTNYVLRILRTSLPSSKANT